MDILILGGTGAMGEPLASMLAEKGNDAYVTSRSEHQSQGRLHYLWGNAKDMAFLEHCLSLRRYDAIVDFMSYTTKEFDNRVHMLLKATRQYVFISSARIFAESKEPLSEDSPRLLDVVNDETYLNTDEYGLSKARQEDILVKSGYSNYTIVRPSVTYNTHRLQLGALEKEDWLYRAMWDRSIVFSHDLADKLTAMTSGDDVAKAICATIGKPECLRQSYNIAIGQSLTWRDILNVYLDTLEDVTGKRPKVVMSNGTIKLKDKTFLYQVIYARRFNRLFDNARIREVYHGGFMEPQKGLADALRAFMKKPAFRAINWKYEAWSDRISHERTPLSEIPTLRGKLIYLFYRHRMGWLYGAGQAFWRIVKSKH